MSYSLQITLLAVLGSFYFGYNLAGFNAVKSAIELDLNWCHFPRSEQFADIRIQNCAKANTYYSIVSAIVYLGACFGSIAAGYIAENGRRIPLLIACCSGCIANIFCASPPSAQPLIGVVMLTIGRFVAGFTIGLQAVTVPVYIAEFVPSMKRGFYGLFHQLSIVISIFLAILLGVAIKVETMPKISVDEYEKIRDGVAKVDALPSFVKIKDETLVISKIELNEATQFYEFYPSMDEQRTKKIYEAITLVPQPLGSFETAWWRFMQVIPVLVLLLQASLLMTKFKSDTPCMNVKWGEHQQAKKTLKKIMENEEEAEKVLQEIVVAQEEQNKQKSIDLIQALQSDYYRKGVIVGVLLAVIQQLSGVNILVSTSTEIFKSAGLESDEALWASVGMGAFNLVMTLPPLWLTDTFGRRTLLLVSFAGQVVFLAMAFIFEVTKKSVDPESNEPLQPETWKGIVIVCCFIAYLGFFAIGAGPIIWLYLSEIFPLEIRSKVMSIAVCGNWLASFVMVQTGPLISSAVLYGTLVAFNAVGLIFVFIWVAETKGLSLEESPLFDASKKPGAKSEAEADMEITQKEGKPANVMRTDPTIPEDADMEVSIADGVQVQL